eukprot:9518-Heterococcus_DN1.PRE.1
MALAIAQLLLLHKVPAAALTEGLVVRIESQCRSTASMSSGVLQVQSVSRQRQHTASMAVEYSGIVYTHSEKG